jgi:NAD(P)-dependent dehydrogenase (short-subunit alcohol dehydrogenase family)
MRLKDKVAIVTGSGRGIGRDIALAYVRESAHVVINDIDPATARATAAEAGKLDVKSLAQPADVSRKADVDRLVDATMHEFGNNAMNRARDQWPGATGARTGAS